MPVLPNPKHEFFCQGLVKGLNATDAYRSAGYEAKGNSAEAAASRLLSDVKIRARVDELKSRAAEGVMISRQRVLEELASLAFAPIGADHIKTADKRNALNDIAIMEGWKIDRKEIGAPGDFARMDDAELERFIADRLPAEPVKKLTAGTKTVGRG